MNLILVPICEYFSSIDRQGQEVKTYAKLAISYIEGLFYRQQNSRPWLWNWGQTYTLEETSCSDHGFGICFPHSWTNSIRFKSVELV